VRDSQYQSGRSNDWTKKTCAQRETLTIAGRARLLRRARGCKRFGSLTKARALARLPLLTMSQLVSAGRKRRKEGKLITRGQRHARQKPNLGYRSDEILRGLKGLAEKWGIISSRLINEDPNLPSAACVAHHFGKLSTAYGLVGIVRLEGKPIRFGLPENE
jgi:hypothetical protein